MIERLTYKITILLAIAMSIQGYGKSFDYDANTETVILDEDFSLAVEGSMDNIDYTGNINSITHISGWTTSGMGQSVGQFVFAPISYPVTLTSPTLSVSDKSPLKVSLTMAEYNNERYYTQGQVEIALIASDGLILQSGDIEISQPRFATYDLLLDVPAGTTSLRLEIAYGGNGSNRKLFLDRIVVAQDADDASVDAIAADMPKAWVSGPNEITVAASKAQLFTVSGRCIYSGGAASIIVNAPIVIAVIDGKVVKLNL